jgi:hypothetical protein
MFLGRDGKGEGNRKADIAGVEKGRMEGQCRVLQDGIETVAFYRCRQPGAGNGLLEADKEDQEGKAD